jgi:HEAT repeat protein
MYCKDKVFNKSVKFMMIVLFVSFFLLSAGHLQAADVDTLVQDLKDNDLIVRLHAAKALGEAKDARAVEPLIAALGDKGCGHTAANALAKIGKPAVEPLIVALKNENPFVRRNAAEALGEIKDASAVKPLVDALKDDDLIVRRDAAKALGKIKDFTAEEPLTSALKDESPAVRRNAAIALREMGKPEAVVVDILY